MKQIAVKLSACVCVLALALSALAACSAPNAASMNEEQKGHRAYMSEVNAIMADLGTSLESFTGAVSRGDVVNMRTQADDAYKTMDKLNSINVPDDMKDINDAYKDGTNKLREALNDYITLYTEMNSGSFDQSTYDARMSAIQSKYNDGVDALKKADETAASK